jgi:hypothetical protein
MSYQFRNKRQAASANALGNVIQHSSGPVLKKKARAAPAREQHQLKRSSVIHRFAWRSVFHR